MAMAKAKTTQPSKAPRLLALASRFSSKRKSWCDDLTPALRQDIAEAVAALAAGRSSVVAADLARAIIAELQTAKDAGEYAGRVPSFSSTWQWVRRQIVSIQGSAK